MGLTLVVVPPGGTKMMGLGMGRMREPDGVTMWLIWIILFLFVSSFFFGIIFLLSIIM